MMSLKNIEVLLERTLFSSRWLLVPVYLGLVVAMFVLLIKFLKQIITLAQHTFSATGAEIIIGVLTLVDISLVMNLLIIIVLSGYENFVSKLDLASDHEDRPEWMGHIGFTDLKIKLIGSIVAISSIELLKAFMNIDAVKDRDLIWMVGIHMTFVFSGVLYAFMDKISHHSSHQKVSQK